MLRLVLWFGAVLIVMRVLQALPVVGGWFHGLLGFWLVVILLSVAGARLTKVLTERRHMAARLRELEVVDSAHNQGKLGTLFLTHGRPRRALAPLEAAVDGEPDDPEWRYRLGCALLAVGRPDEAVERLGEAARLDAEHAYGGVQLRLAEACLAARAPDAALAALDVFDRNHGENPESLYRRGCALAAVGRKREARECWSRVGHVAGSGAAFQRRSNARWVALATWRRLFG